MSIFATIAASLMLTATPAPDTSADPCESAGRLAEVVMHARQEGAAMSNLMRVADQAGDLRTLTRVLIMEAFDRPRHHTPGQRQRAIEDFRADIELACYREFSL